jgi:nucleoside-diphosphate kinase
MKTLLMVKPDTTAEGHYGDIISTVLRNGFEITRLGRTEFSKERAERFYEVHKERPFFPELVSYMTSGPVICIEAVSDEAVSRMRQLIGATDPADAVMGTFRKMYGKSLQNNAVHGSDSAENAEKELAIAFEGS